MRVDIGQANLVEVFVPQRMSRSGWFAEIDRLADWRQLGVLFSDAYASREGGASYPISTYVKLLLLQQWHGLSDERLRNQVDDRLFAGVNAQLDARGLILRQGTLIDVDAERRKRLRAAGVKARLLHKAKRNKPLRPWQKAFNKAVSRIRAAVERPFAAMKGPFVPWPGCATVARCAMTATCIRSPVPAISGRPRG